MIAIIIYKNILIQFPITEFFLIHMNAITRNTFTQIAFFCLKYFPGHVLLRVS